MWASDDNVQLFVYACLVDVMFVGFRHVPAIKAIPPYKFETSFLIRSPKLMNILLGHHLDG